MSTVGAGFFVLDIVACAHSAELPVIMNANIKPQTNEVMPRIKE